MAANINAPYKTWAGYSDPRFMEWPPALRLMARTAHKWIATDRQDAISVMAALYEARNSKSFRGGSA